MQQDGRNLLDLAPSDLTAITVARRDSGTWLADQKAFVWARGRLLRERERERDKLLFLLGLAAVATPYLLRLPVYCRACNRVLRMADSMQKGMGS